MATLIDINSLNVYYNMNVPNDTTGWIVDPDLSAVAGIPSMFWVVNSDNTIGPMTEDQINAAYLQTAINSQCNVVSSYRDQILYSGFNYNGDLYDSDPQSITNISGTQGFVNAGGTLPDNFVWRDANNINQSYSNETFTEFYMSSVAWVEAIWTVSWIHKANISALTDYNSVMTYDFTVDWPTGFAAGAVTFT
jgi:hypothetical protein